MSLDVFVYGPGFGEAIILRWESSQGICGALVDGLGAGDGHWLEQRLRALGISELRFLVATHPHLDHIENLAKSMRLLDWSVDCLWWWGGLGQQAFIEYYNRLADQTGQPELRGTAAAVRDLLQDSRIAQMERNRPAVMDAGFGTFLYQQAMVSDERLRVRSLSPCAGPLLRYARQVCGAIHRGGQILHQHHDANLASVSLLIEYGDAQILLSGDAEDTNWREIRGRLDVPPLRPSLVKVSHHGSRNGRIDGMWTAEGFFGQRAASSLAVITPWRPMFNQGGRTYLPNDDTIQEIRDAGFTVYVTGEGDPESLGRRIESFVHVQVEEDGTASMVEQKLTKVFEPSTV